MPKIKLPKFSAERLREVLDYDPDTGRMTWLKSNSSQSTIGGIAGFVASNGRRYVSIDGDPQLAHRLAWYHVHGKWPEKNISPKNGDYLDLRLDNLVLEDIAQTARKKVAIRSGSSGVKGVNWDRRKKKWQVTITRDYVMKHLGHYDDLEEARVIYEKAVADYVSTVSPEERDRRSKIVMDRVKARSLWKKVIAANTGHTWEDLDHFMIASPWRERPGKNWQLYPVDPDTPIGPDNCVWKEHFRYDHRSREGRRTYRADSRIADPRRFRDADLRKTYGIGLEEYEKMHSAQDGVCAICGNEETDLSKGGMVRELAVDHCHKTGELRDLLCGNCNRGIGNFFDDPERIEKALLYVRRHMKEKN